MARSTTTERASKAVLKKSRARRPAVPTESERAVACPSVASYDPSDIEDAPEFHELSRSMGTLTWTTWDDGARPFEQRVRDFLFAYPPESPASHSQGRLVRQPDKSFASSDDRARLDRFMADTWDLGSKHEL